MLDKIIAYHTKLDTPKNLKNEFLFVTADCHPTVHILKINGERTYIPGDGRVSHMSAFPLDELENKEDFTVCQKHDLQLNDPKIVGKVFDFLKKSSPMKPNPQRP